MYQTLLGPEDNTITSLEFTTIQWCEQISEMACKAFFGRLPATRHSLKVNKSYQMPFTECRLCLGCIPDT